MPWPTLAEWHVLAQKKNFGAECPEDVENRFQSPNSLGVCFFTSS
jgi:hypothetical protein